MIRSFAPSRLAAAVAGVGLLVALAASPARADYDLRYTAGHADINIGYDASAGSLFLNLEMGSNAVVNGSPLGVGGAGEFEANTITIVLGTNSLTTGSASLPSPFGGNPLYTLPQTSISGRPFLGIGAETVEPGVFQNDTLNLNLTAMSVSPAGGQFVVWQIGSESSPFFNSANGFTTADLILVGAGSHDHFSYGFTAPGVYDVLLSASARLADDTLVAGSSVYRFEVVAAPVPEPASIAMMGIGVGIAGLAMRRRLRASMA